MSTTWREGVGAFSPRSTSLLSTTAKLSYHMSFYYTGHTIVPLLLLVSLSVYC
jgi:hypothetical protein